MEVNNKVLELLQKNSAFSEEEKNTLRLYSGFGGINADDERGVLYDYYTSPPLARLTWRMLDKIEPLKTGERVLEPSCGTGVFIDNAPDGLLCSGVELDKRTAAVASALQNKAAVFNMSFEQFNLSDAAGGFDRVIGNAPFGARPADVAELDMPEEKSLDNYFVNRSVDNLKDGGTVAVITAPGLLNNKSNENFRRELSKKAQFIGAVQLPNKSFYHTHTNVQPAVLFFKKYPRDIERRMKAIDDKTFQTTSLYDRNFAEGSYFKAYPHHVMGELSEGTGQFGGDEIIGELTQEGIDNILSSFTPSYQHDDVTFDELRQIYALPDDKERDSLPLSSDEVSLLKADKLPSIKISDNTLRILSNDSRWEFLSDDKTFIDKVERTARLASTVTSVREAMKAGNDDIKLHQSAARAILDAYKTDFGCHPLDDKDIRRLVNKYPAVKGVYDAFITPSSEILTSANIYASDIEIVDGHNPAVKALVDLQNALIPATEANIKDRFPASAESLIKEMFVNNDIFYTPKGVWQLREDFISGDAWQKIDMLRASAASAENDRIKEKLLYGAAELEKAVGWTPVEEADVSPLSSWLDEEIIRNWASSVDGLDHHELTKLAKNNEGKWGITEENIWQEYPHPLVYYLNGQKQRSPYIDTKVYNEEHDELFKAFISNHPGHRQSIEQTYNRLFKTYLTSPVKTYPVEINGWKDADAGGKTLNPHQWQTIHHLYRQGSGISALGTGFGKTASAIGLMSLLRQEGKLSRVWLQAPNNKVKDWIAEIKDVMPSLKIASIDPEEPGYASRDKRYARYRQIANSKADIIIMPESAASEIQLKKDNDAAIREKIAGDYKTEKIISNASRRQTATAELKGLSDTQNGKTNPIVNFEDFGCDAVFVDEAHNYKNLFSSGLSRETGINDGRQSAKAMSLFKKTDFIRENNGGKNVFLLTATPLTNSPLEYYNMLQFIASDELKRFSIMSIDGFIREFADIKEGIKYDWTKNSAGWGKILSGFKNLQTLQELFFKYTDLQNNPEAVGLEKPEPYNMPNLIPGDKDQIVVLKSISDEIERYRSLDIEDRKAEYPGQNFLTFYSQMRTASLDLELFDPDTYKDWKNPKLEKLAANVKSIFDNTSGGQVIFCDRIFDSNAQFNLHDKIKSSLVLQGFNESEIVIINGFTKSGDKEV